MAPGVKGIEGSTHGHDVIPVKNAIEYLNARGYTEGANLLQGIKANSIPYIFLGASKEKEANRVQFGEAVSNFLDKIPKEEAKKKVMVIDCKLTAVTLYLIVLTLRFPSRSRGLDWSQGHPHQASRGLHPIRYHGAWQLLRGGRFRLRF